MRPWYERAIQMRDLVHRDAGLAARHAPMRIGDVADAPLAGKDAGVSGPRARTLCQTLSNPSIVPQMLGQVGARERKAC
jgi:hypothetical protein